MPVTEGEHRGVSSPVDADLIERVKAEKALRRSSPQRYRDHPAVSFIVLSFNRGRNIEQIIEGLRGIDQHELIVCDDGSVDGSRQTWLTHLSRPNDFLVLSNDIHEIRILDRAIRFAAADIVCLVQDDDTVPQDPGWLHRGLEAFARHPKLAILGGFMGFLGFGTGPNAVKCIWKEAPLQFVDHVNIGPYFIRKLHYESLGGWDFSFSRAGEPGICFDNELCLRAWVRGYQVAYSFAPFKGPPGKYSEDGGTMLFSRDIRMRNQWQNQRKISSMYARDANRIAELVKQANQCIGFLGD